MDPEKLRRKVAPEHTAFVVVDMLKDYCCEGGVLTRLGFDVGAANALGPRLESFVDRVRPKLRHLVHLHHERAPHLVSPAAAEHYGRAGLARDHDPRWSESFGVTPRPEDIVIKKYKYSGFVGTPFELYLKSNLIQTLVLTGVATNVCVESTARDAFMREYSVVVPEDLTEGTSEEAKRWSLANIEGFFGEVVHSDALLACWEA